MARFFFTVLDGSNVCYAWDETAFDPARARELADEIAADLADGGAQHHGMTICVNDADGNEIANVKVARASVYASRGS